MTALAASVLADAWPDHHDLGTGGWIAMVFGMVIFWGVLVVWLVRGGLNSRSDTPEDTLRRRLAEGSISIEEFEQRRAALNPQAKPNVDPPVASTAHGQT